MAVNFAEVLKAYATAVKIHSADSQTTDFCKLVECLEEAKITGIAKISAALVSQASANASELGPKLADTTLFIEGLLNILRTGGARKKVLEDLQAMLDLFRAHSQLSIAAF